MGQEDGTTAHALERVIGLFAREAGLRVLERSRRPGREPGTGVPVTGMPLTPDPGLGDSAPAVVAFYLPQYHPIPENDEWWGEGFTDWVKVGLPARSLTGISVPYVPG